MGDDKTCVDKGNGIPVSVPSGTAGMWRLLSIVRFCGEKKLFIQAPTGVGKTISTVFPAVKAVGEGLGDKIFYLTAEDNHQNCG